MAERKAEAEAAANDTNSPPSADGSSAEKGNGISSIGATPSANRLTAMVREVTQDDDGEDAHPVRQLAQGLANLKGAPVLTFWGLDSIERDAAEAVYSVMEGLPDNVDELWLVLSSAGGSLDAAYQVARLLQARAKKVFAVVPRWAKSAATLLTLGCDEVVMHPLAELGPLDAQVQTHRHGEVSYMSTLDAVRANEYLRLYAVDTFDKLMSLITKRSPVTYPSAVAMAANVLEPLIKPMYAKVDPVQLGEYDRALALATEYGRRLMKRSYGGISVADRDRILTRLVKDYAAHSFVIDLQEAKEMGLNVREPTEEERKLLNRCATFFCEHELHNHDDIDLTLPEKKDGAVFPLAGGKVKS